MSVLPQSIQHLIDQFAKLPGIGPKMASRLTFWLLNRPEPEIAELSQAVINLKSRLVRCRVCHTITDKNPCKICADAKRDSSKLMVVEDPLDLVALEKTGYDGRYHVLGGVISPIDGIGPEQLTVAELLQRLDIARQDPSTIKEVILATDPSLEGEATAMYIDRRIAQLKEEATVPKSLKVTRIARGLPVGGDLEYADEVTLSRALEGRKEY